MKALKIAIVGYGKMGRKIESKAMQRGHEITHIIDPLKGTHIEDLLHNRPDVVIEFTQPFSVVHNLHFLLDNHLPIVCGTTGWLKEKTDIEKKTIKNNACLVYASNFSIGVNILFKLNEMLAKMMNAFPDYDVWVEEKHHALKKDGPSGTALSLAEGIIKDLDRKSEIAGNLMDRHPEPSELSIGFIRSGNIVGEHSVGYVSEHDEITIKHTAHSREGFAIGAILAAEWAVQNKGFHEFKNISIV